VRIEAKKLRYALEIQRELTQSRSTAGLNRLKTSRICSAACTISNPDRRARGVQARCPARSPRHVRAEQADSRPRRRVPRRPRRLHARRAALLKLCDSVIAAPTSTLHRRIAHIHGRHHRAVPGSSRDCRGTRPKYPDDRLRPLTPAGSKKFAESVPGLAEMDVVIDFVLTSPLVRARETAQLLAAGLKPKPAIAEDRSARARRPAPGDRRGDQDAREAASPLALVGHEPDLGELAAQLLGARGMIEFKKGACA
jgi:phosphohistidine phosphatase